MALIFPPPLLPGSRVAVVAPSSPFRAEEFHRGIEWVRERYDVELSLNIEDKQGYLAGSDERRAAELAQAMSDPGIDAILCARGGYGAMRIAPGLPFEAMVQRPKWLVGFSDITCLHIMLNVRGIASIHGPHITGLGRDTGERTKRAFLGVLERPANERVFAALEVIHPGRAVGTLFGGNLSLVESLATMGELSMPKDTILMLEDVTERPYRVDRMLTALIAGGHMRRVVGIVFGSFTECNPGPDGVRIEEVLRERTKKLGIPVMAGAPFGHGAENDSFVLGAAATLEVGSLTIHGARSPDDAPDSKR